MKGGLQEGENQHGAFFLKVACLHFSCSLNLLHQKQWPPKALKFSSHFCNITHSHSL